MQFEVAAPDSIQNLNFLSIEFTQYLPQPAGTYYIIVGADDGSILAYDNQKQEYVDLGMRSDIIEGEVGVISVKSNSIVIGSSRGIVAYYQIIGSQI